MLACVGDRVVLSPCDVVVVTLRAGARGMERCTAARDVSRGSPRDAMWGLGGADGGTGEAWGRRRWVDGKRSTRTTSVIHVVGNGIIVTIYFRSLLLPVQTSPQLVTRRITW